MHRHPAATGRGVLGSSEAVSFCNVTTKALNLDVHYVQNLLSNLCLNFISSRIRTPKWLELHWNLCTDYYGFTWSELNVKAIQLPKGKVLYLGCSSILVEQMLLVKRCYSSPEHLWIEHIPVVKKKKKILKTINNKIFPFVPLSVILPPIKITIEVILILEKLKITLCHVKIINILEWRVTDRFIVACNVGMKWNNYIKFLAKDQNKLPHYLFISKKILSWLSKWGWIYNLLFIINEGLQAPEVSNVAFFSLLLQSTYYYCHNTFPQRVPWCCPKRYASKYLCEDNTVYCTGMRDQCINVSNQLITCFPSNKYLNQFLFSEFL